MNKALITFSNGAELIVTEGQRFIPISKVVEKNEIFASQCESHEIWYHVHDELIPSICDLLCKCDFFRLLEDNSTVYNSNSVVSIKNL
ncbi:MAG: hypothetical protein ACRDD2_00015 [Sarcina sp.]